MKANYHTHTWRCMHAVGEEKEYVERAIEGGLQILGFSDHTPYPFPDNYVSGMRMRMDQLEDYVDTVLSLKAEYRNEIEIHLGLEVEYYPAYFPQLLDVIADYPVEYFLLAQHHLG
ncbi:MAG: PHP domain-containing protein, partial [Fusicatenibacter sp.]|nr:PHP domain-containing protein [Fusicatenibacter sp.]